MAERRKDLTWIDLQLAVVRWLAYLATAVSFVLVGLLAPDRIAFSFSDPPVLILVAFVILFNLIVTTLAYFGWLATALPVTALVVDLIITAAAYYFLGMSPDLLGLVIDPLFFLALVPVLAGALRFHWLLGTLLALLVGVMRSLLLLWGMPEPFATANLLPAFFGVLVFVALAAMGGYLADISLSGGMKKQIEVAQREARQYKSALEQAEILQQITSTLGSTLNFERVIAQALDVAEQAMSDWGAKGQLIGMVLLFKKGKRMRVAAGRGLSRHDMGRDIEGESGIVARCLDKADIVVTNVLRDDPELFAFTGLSDAKVAAAAPLRAGFNNYGAMVFATAAFDTFDKRQLDLFAGIADRATIALHNALLYQNLQAEKDRIVRIEEDARHKLSRDLHDGPTQSVSAIAMRLNFIRKMMTSQDPQRVLAEIQVIEDLARQTVKEIRHMLFTLRPLVLETQGLVPALHTLVEKLQETAELNIQIREKDNATDRLDPNQAGVIFYIIEEALGNARKYSKADLIEVKLWIEQNLFVVQVKDNGVGFDTQQVLGSYESRGSLGMVNMRERAELIEGSLDVKSAPGKGTVITVVVPLVEQSQNSQSRRRNRP